MSDKCRICGHEGIANLGTYKPYEDYETQRFRCSDCKSIFVAHDEAIYEKLHASVSSYSDHENMARQINELDEFTVRKKLEKSQINISLLNAIKPYGKTIKIAEIGCSTGIITNYLRTLGYDVIGFDISESAIKKAKKLFGEGFYVYSNKEMIKHAPFDVIFHLGTIGCVSDPNIFNENLLGYLNNNGTLFFNAPNVTHLDYSKKEWLSTTPPDLVTLFHPDFFKKTLGNKGELKVTIIGHQLTELIASKLGKSISQPKMLFQNDKPKSTTITKSEIGNVSVTAALKTVIKNALSKIRLPIPGEYGILVKLKKVDDRKLD